jgi:hypothetical protein
MKPLLTQILTLLIIITSCSKNCDSVYEIANCSDNQIPIFQIDFNKPDSINFQNLEKIYNEKLCDRCTWVPFRLPYEFQNRNGYLKILVDCDSPYCADCPVAMRHRYTFDILINSRNQLLVEGDLNHLDSLRYSIRNYYEKIAKQKPGYPERYDQVHFQINWDKESKKEVIFRVLDIITTEYSSNIIDGFPENKYCNLTNEEKLEINLKYPLNISFELQEMNIPPPPKFIETETEQVETDIELKE